LLILKIPVIPSIGDYVDELEFFDTVGGNVKWYSQFGKV
jgi:hypothetical protein